ncbi:MAG: glycine betaine ABC transporter substrate-binding protein [Fusobacterium sp. JB021]|nr:glycine betaine ABC transporter substrate-binding protein [Fusobacterium sp. JB021]
MNLITYMIENHSQILSLLIEHLELTLLSVGLAILIGVPLGILVSYVKKLSKPILGASNVMQAIPSMALLGFMIPFLGIGSLPAIVAVILYSLLPIIKNTYIGIDNINPQTIEAAKGIGLTKFQILTRIQIPLALPVIMGGVRISSVTAVGLMTIAAFIGAGGLGFLVFSGIRTVNNLQILSGAIPACLLALTMDYLAGLVEKLVTPISLQKSNTYKKPKNRLIAKGILFFSLLLIIFSFGYTSLSKNKTNDKTIIIGSKDYTEQVLLGNLVGDMIEENTDISVIKRTSLGGTQVCFSALNAKEIDMYVEYSGTAFVEVLNHKPISDVEKVYNTCKKEYKEKYNIEILPQINFNNTYVMAVTQETAKKYNLKTVTDLSKVAHKLIFGTSFEFLSREDGLPGLMKKYDFKVKETRALEDSPKYIAIANNKIDVTDAFSTDALIKKYNLVTLEDDKHFFPPYYPMPIVRADVYEKYPEIKDALKNLSQALTDKVMTDLNYQVNELHKSPEEVSKNFLIENNYFKD